ncbi:tyrosinase cofactor [Streptomyces sp. LX-29]|uniref:apotyrosinase chaperone MelC1 n=1 Tax=Streptomyces sp. LX-29 TaxID=2900152 RepID=UPI00240D923A|nr:tyrosinase cofactor [Streptomyces sp. LX-29]WFB09552.1 tyrosinase cofactor [Streptomyces sp. LX-29]
MPSNPTRRLILRGTTMAVAGAALAGTAATAAVRSEGVGTGDAAGHGGGTGHAGTAAPAPFVEVYQGRHIAGRATGGDGGHDGGGHHEVGYSVYVDGEELHLMRNADDTWISVINHYETFRDPRAVARAAVDKLRGAELVPIQTA